MMKIRIALVMMLATAAVCLAGADFHVAPDGDDRNPGTLEKPFATPYSTRRGDNIVQGEKYLPRCEVARNL